VEGKGQAARCRDDDPEINKLKLQNNIGGRSDNPGAFYSKLEQIQQSHFDRLSVSWLWEGYHESRRCSRDTHPEAYITKYTSIRRLN